MFALTRRGVGRIDLTRDNYSVTIEVNQPPTPTYGSVSIYLFDADADGALGITSFEFLDTPSGPNKKVDFGGIPTHWPPAMWQPLMTRITVAGVMSGRWYFRGTFTLDYWEWG